MKFKQMILVGAPGSGKSEVRNYFKNFKSENEKEKKQLSYLRFLGKPSSDSLWAQAHITNTAALGQLSDYRTELKLAVGRIGVPGPYINERHVVLTHSLLDSVAHVTTRLYNMVNSGSVSEIELARWDLTLNMVSLILADSLYPCPIIFLRGNDGDPFNIAIEEALSIILNDWGIPHLELTNVEDTAIMIRKIVLDEFDFGKAVAAGASTENSSSENNQ